MKHLKKIVFLVMTIGMTISCSSGSAQKYETLALKRPDGIIIFAIDKITAEINYNIIYNHKKTNGEWKQFGEPIERDNDIPLQFQAVNHGTKGTVFWAIEPDGRTYVTNDFQNNPNRKKWLPFGNTLDSSNGDYEFHAQLRGPGKTSLIAVNQNTGKLFFMHTFGNSKKWLPYGGTVD